MPFGIGPPGEILRPPHARKIVLTDQEAHEDLQRGGIPSPRTIDMVDNQFPGASHISWFNGYLLFEFPKESREAHLKRRSILPQEISGCTVTVMNGGLILGQMRARQNSPDPTNLSADIYDDTNYLHRPHPWASSRQRAVSPSQTTPRPRTGRLRPPPNGPAQGGRRTGGDFREERLHSGG